MLQPIGSQRARHDWVTELIDDHLFLVVNVEMLKKKKRIINSSLLKCGCAPVEENIFSPLYILASFVTDQMPIVVWVYLWAFYLVPFYICFCTNTMLS